MKYADCIKYPSKGGYSREELDRIASEKGLNPKVFKNKNLLCEILSDDVEKSETSAIKKTTTKKTPTKKSPTKKITTKKSPTKKITTKKIM